MIHEIAWTYNNRSNSKKLKRSSCLHIYKYFHRKTWVYDLVLSILTVCNHVDFVKHYISSFFNKLWRALRFVKLFSSQKTYLRIYNTIYEILIKKYIIAVKGAIPAKILGGKNAWQAESKFVVQIKEDGIPVCGGALISHRHVYLFYVVTLKTGLYTHIC